MRALLVVVAGIGCVTWIGGGVLSAILLLWFVKVDPGIWTYVRVALLAGIAGSVVMGLAITALMAGDRCTTFGWGKPQ
ncbi:MAG: hypothetical protein AB7O80_10900 [Acetobacteraceae bacterium]